MHYEYEPTMELLLLWQPCYGEQCCLKYYEVCVDPRGNRTVEQTSSSPPGGILPDHRPRPRHLGLRLSRASEAGGASWRRRSPPQKQYLLVPRPVFSCDEESTHVNWRARRRSRSPARKSSILHRCRAENANGYAGSRRCLPS